MPFTPATNFAEATRVRAINGPPAMRRINGIGTTLCGRWPEPTFRDVYFKQLVVTIIFVPIWLGFTYAVIDGEGGGWHFVGRITGHDFRDRFGWPAYFRFKFAVLTETVVVGAILFAVILGVSLGARWLFHRQ